VHTGVTRTLRLCHPMLPAQSQPAGVPCPSPSSPPHPHHTWLQPLPVTASHLPTPRVPCEGGGTDCRGRGAAEGTTGFRGTRMPCPTPSPHVPSCPTGREPGPPLPPQHSSLSSHRALYAPT